MPTEKTYVRTIVGRSARPNRRRQTGGNPMLAMAAMSALPAILPIVAPLVSNLAGKLFKGQGTRLAGQGKKKKTHRY